MVITSGLEGSYQTGFYPTPRTELLLGVERALEKGLLRVGKDVKGWTEVPESEGAAV